MGCEKEKQKNELGNNFRTDHFHTFNGLFDIRAVKAGEILGGFESRL
jgi:hypothetical protein